jgi:hypothetical protein
MKELCLCFFGSLIISQGSTLGQQFDNNYGKPLIVLTETDPWAMVIGSDVPTFALYEKGQIIYKVIEQNQLKLYEVVLKKDELQKMIQSLSISDAFYKLQDNITAAEFTDQPSNILTLNIKQKKSINVYGMLNGNSEARKKIPGDFLIVYDNIKKYKSSSAKEWLPPKIEVMFWDYHNAPDKRAWLKGFPDLNSPSTNKRSSGIYSVYIDKSKFDQFKNYFSSLGIREAVEINGKKMSVSYRLSFPNIK